MDNIYRTNNNHVILCYESNICGEDVICDDVDNQIKELENIDQDSIVSIPDDSPNCVFISLVVLLLFLTIVFIVFATLIYRNIINITEVSPVMVRTITALVGTALCISSMSLMFIILCYGKKCTEGKKINCDKIKMLEGKRLEQILDESMSNRLLALNSCSQLVSTVDCTPIPTEDEISKRLLALTEENNDDDAIDHDEILRRLIILADGNFSEIDLSYGGQ